MKVEIWHNPRCSKSRQTLELLESRGIEPVVVHYLESPPSKKRLREVLGLLGKKPFELGAPESVGRPSRSSRCCERAGGMSLRRSGAGDVDPIVGTQTDLDE